jgi:hypothetical protein
MGTVQVSELKRVCPRRDSNPCFQIENLGSWASLDDGDAMTTLTYAVPPGKVEGPVPLQVVLVSAAAARSATIR